MNDADKTEDIVVVWRLGLAVAALGAGSVILLLLSYVAAVALGA